MFIIAVIFHIICVLINLYSLPTFLNITKTDDGYSIFSILSAKTEDEAYLKYGIYLSLFSPIIITNAVFAFLFSSLFMVLEDISVFLTNLISKIFYRA